MVAASPRDCWTAACAAAFARFGKPAKSLEKLGERERRLPASVLSDGERLVRLAIAVDDDERDLLELGVADALAEGLVALVDLRAEAFAS